MIKSQTKNELCTSLELTPLIDIIFIVVVFLLLTANSRLLSLPVDIPASDDAVASENSDQNSLTISIFRSAPVWAIEQQRFENWDEFKQVLLKRISANQQQTLAIAAEHDAEVEPLLKLLALLNQQQVTNTRILMEESRP